MTLVVYKNNELAADSRGSTEIERTDGHCAKCSAPVNKVVVNNKEKIKLPQDVEVKYMGETVLATGKAGNAHFTTSMINYLFAGKDIHEIYGQHTSLIMGEPLGAVIMIVTSDKVIVLRSYNPTGPSKRKMRDFHIQTFGRNETVMIGSGATEGRVIDKLTGGLLSAKEIIELTKEHNDSVGGDVKFHDFTETKKCMRKFVPENTRFTKSKILEAIKSIPPIE